MDPPRCKVTSLESTWKWLTYMGGLQTEVSDASGSYSYTPKVKFG